MKRILFLLSFCALAVLVAAQPAGFEKMESLQVFVDGYTGMCKHTTSFMAHFEQVKKVTLLKNELRSKGVMIMRADNKIKIAYTQPYKYVFAMSNESITIKDGDAAANSMNMRNNKLFKQISAITLSGINGKLLETKGFTTAVFESPRYYMVQAFPQTKEMKAFYTSFELYFNKHTFQVEKIVMAEVSGDISTMVFSNVEINKEIDNAVFVVY